MSTFVRFHCSTTKLLDFITKPFLYITLLATLLFQKVSWAQLQVSTYPVGLTQYTQQMVFHCPAALVSWNKWESSVTTRRNTGFWRNNQTYFATGGFRIQKKEKENYHGLGMSLYYDKEGSYLKRYRGYLQYAYHVRLNEQWTVSAGLSMGIMSYQVGNEEYVGGTGNTYDGALGVMLYRTSFYLGGTLFQLPESKVQPISEITVLERYYQLIAGKEFELVDDFSLRTNINARIFKNLPPDIYGQAGIVWNKTVSLYGSYRWDKQAALMFGLERIEWEGMQLRTYFSYDVAVNGDRRYQAFEITLQWLMPEIKKTTEPDETEDNE